MTRLGNLYGTDVTFLGVPAADPDEISEWSTSAAVIIGAPFDGGTSHRPGARFGPQAIRTTDDCRVALLHSVNADARSNTVEIHVILLF